MAKKTFSLSDKEKAVKMMAEGKLTHKQIAGKFGCSVPALILWRKNSRSEAAVQEEEEWEEEWEEDDDDWEDDEEETQPSDTAQTGVVGETEAILQLKKQYWSEDYRAANMLLTPAGADPEDVVRLINEALEYAYRKLR